MARLARPLAFALIAVAALVSPLAARAAAVQVRLALSQQFYYEGDALNVRITVDNPGAAAIPNPIHSALFSGFRVRREGTVLAATGKPSAEEPARPEKISANAFYGGTVNLVELYPELRSRGTFEIYWGADNLLSDMVVVTVIPRFDPMKAYVGEIETDQGRVVFDLYGNQAPVAVKAFVDMAHVGFYDGSLVSEVHVDGFVVAGDPRFADKPRIPIQFPAEPSSAALVAGTVVMRPVRANPPTNGPTLVILLRPQPTWTGQVTVLGQVVEGLDVVERISRVPSSMKNSEPYFKPLSDVHIKKVSVREKAPPQAGS